MSDIDRRRRAFSVKVVEDAHTAGLDGPNLVAALMNVLATIYVGSAKGDAARFEAYVEETSQGLRSFPGAPPPPLDPARLISDDELVAYDSLIRAAIRWTKGPKAKVIPSFDLIMAELRRLRRRHGA